jgi:hypothetical protein
MTTRYAATIFALAFGSVLLLGADLARANSDMPLDQVGGVCIPDSATIRAGGYETRGFGVGFHGSSTGAIRLLCPFTVTANMLDVKIGLIFMSVIDGDGMNTGARVRAFFRHAGIGTNVAVTDATCDSNTSNTTGPQNMACFFHSETININVFYWWDILIERTDPKVNVEFLGVGMRGAAS